MVLLLALGAALALVGGVLLALVVVGVEEKSEADDVGTADEEPTPADDEAGDDSKPVDDRGVEEKEADDEAGEDSTPDGGGGAMDEEDEESTPADGTGTADEEDEESACTADRADRQKRRTRTKAGRRSHTRPDEHRRDDDMAWTACEVKWCTLGCDDKQWVVWMWEWIVGGAAVTSSCG